MKKVFSLLITLAMLVSVAVVPMSVSADASVWDGTTTDVEWAGEGTEADPYLITSAAEFAGLAKTLFDADETSTAFVSASLNERMYFAYTGKYFKLTTDIDLDNKEWTPIGRFNLRFDGIFDGGEHVVKNVYMRRQYSAMGLFGGTGRNARIFDLGVDGIDVVTAVGGTVADYVADSLTRREDRVQSLGGFIGAMCPGGTAEVPMVENCFVKNVKMATTSTNMSHRAMGAFYGTAGYLAVNADTTNTGNRVYLKNCYTMNVDLTGYANVGAFFGGGWGVFAWDYRSTPYLTNCYAGGDIVLKNVTGSTSIDALFNIGSIYGNDYSFSNVYTATNAYTSKDGAEVYANKETIDSNLSTVDGWCEDNEKAPINDGYPVLAWENTWSSIWGGPTDIDTNWAGEGTADSPYQITSAAELAGLAKNIADAISTTTSIPVSSTLVTNMYFAYTDTYFELTTDIDLAKEEWLPIGRYGMRFNGNFDGNNHVIKNLYMREEKTGAGLFGGTGNKVRIANLGLEDVDIQTSVGAATDYVANGDGSQTIMNRCRGFGSLIGAAAPSGTNALPAVENCYAKNVTIKMPVGTNMNHYGMGGLVGQVYYAKYAADTTNEYNKFCVKNCYVQDVDLRGYTSVGGFVGSFCVNADYRVNPNLTNCYVADVTLATCATDSYKDTITNLYDFAYILRSDASQCTMTNVFTTATEWTDAAAGGTKPPTYGATADTIAQALVTGNNTWNLDSVKNPVNGGYPVLGWEKWWTTESDPLSSFRSAGVTVTDGNVTAVTVIQSDSAVTGTVVAAVYNGDRFEGATTATAVNGTITLTTPLAADAGDTVKVFVWNSLDGISPLADVYSTIVTAPAE